MSSGRWLMSRLWRSATALVAMLLLVSLSVLPAMAADCEPTMQQYAADAIGNRALQPALAAYLTHLMAAPRYFEGDPAKDCSAFRQNQPLYPGIPVRDCEYQELGLKGWVMLADPTPELATKWILHACAGMVQETTCITRLTAYTWCSNNLSFPIAGNIIEDAASGGGQGEQGANYAFLHGVTIAAPAWLPAGSVVDFAIQKAQFEALAATANAYTGDVMQVSRPSGIRREIYTQYAVPLPINPPLDIGKSTSGARRPEWLAVSRLTYIEAWQTGQNRMFDAAAKALMAGICPGKLGCEIHW